MGRILVILLLVVAALLLFLSPAFGKSFKAMTPEERFEAYQQNLKDFGKEQRYSKSSFLDSSLDEQLAEIKREPSEQELSKLELSKAADVRRRLEPGSFENIGRVALGIVLLVIAIAAFATKDT